MRTAVLRHFTLFVVAVAPIPLTAQQPPDQTGARPTGRIVGNVIEQTTGSPIAGAQVALEGTALRATSAIDGRYTLLGAPAGPVTVHVRAIGYAPRQLSGVEVPAGGIVRQDVTLQPMAVQLAEIAVSAPVEHGTVRAAMEEQRTAVNIMSAITSEQIERSPDGDAGQAVQRVSGVTVQDGRYVFVRGLGERYTQTSLNRARLPSPEPERRTVPLDLFPSNLIASIATTKTFTPDQPGDFTGGQVDVRTREFPLGRRWSLSTSFGINPDVTGRRLPSTRRTGEGWLGFAGRERQMPRLAREAGDLSGQSQERLQSVIGSFRNAWSALPGSASGNGSVSASVGGEDPLFGQLIGYVASFGYSISREARINERRATAVAGAEPGETRPQNELAGTTVATSVLWGGVANVTARVGATGRLAFNNTFTRSADDQVTRLSGYNEEFARLLDITRLSFVERTMRSHQMTGQHLLFGRHTLEWQATSSVTGRHEPDRSDLIYDAVADSAGQVSPTTWFGLGRSAARTFSDLSENTADLAFSYRIEFGAGRRWALKFGAASRYTRRTADSRAFYILNLNLSDDERAAPAESIFAHPERLTLAADANVGRYRADDRVTAGFALLEVPVNSHLRLTAGARIEVWRLDMATATVGGSTVGIRRRNTDWLPSLALLWTLRPDQNLRFSVSQTLSRPEYREMAPLTSRDIAGGLDFFGDSSLTRSLVQNIDLRWEHYVGSDEIISLALFSKRFARPIERILVGTTGATTVSYANAASARNLGVEIELRRNLGAVATAFDRFTIAANLTLMSSEVRPGADRVASHSSAARPMVGQAAYVANAGLGYSSEGGWLAATLLYNVVGRRIHEAGTVLLPDAYEEPHQALDLSVRLRGPLGTRVRFDARNLLDSPYRITQGSVTRFNHRNGRTFSLGMSWQS